MRGESPQRIAINHPPVCRSMAAASSGHEDWRKCHEVDLRRLRQRGSRRGRIRGEVHLGDSGERRPLPRAEGRCGRRDVPSGAFGKGARRGGRVTWQCGRGRAQAIRPLSPLTFEWLSCRSAEPLMWERRDLGRRRDYGTPPRWVGAGVSSTPTPTPPRSPPDSLITLHQRKQGSAVVLSSCLGTA